LFPHGGTVDVPFLSDLQYTRKELISKDGVDDIAHEEDVSGDIRAAWKDYLRRTLPHAFTQIRNFMLACVAEGRNFEDEDESLKRGEALRCNLTLCDLKQALSFNLPGSDSSTAHEGTSASHDPSGATQRVWKSAKLAVQLANLAEARRDEAVDKCQNITKLCWSQSLSKTSSPGPEAPETIANAQLLTTNWRDRYAIWQAEVFQPSPAQDDEDDHGFLTLYPFDECSRADISQMCFKPRTSSCMVYSFLFEWLQNPGYFSDRL
jgi:hypothetical protein